LYLTDLKLVFVERWFRLREVAALLREAISE